MFQLATNEEHYRMLAKHLANNYFCQRYIKLLIASSAEAASRSDELFLADMPQWVLPEGPLCERAASEDLFGSPAIDEDETATDDVDVCRSDPSEVQEHLELGSEQPEHRTAAPVRGVLKRRGEPGSQPRSKKLSLNEDDTQITQQLIRSHRCDTCLWVQ